MAIAAYNGSKQKGSAMSLVRLLEKKRRGETHTEEEIQALSGQMTIIIASNQRYEYGITKNLIQITDFKSSLK